MDKGAFVKSEISIIPTANGSYLVRRLYGNRDYRVEESNDMACFTDHADLLIFLCSEYNAANLSVRAAGEAE